FLKGSVSAAIISLRPATTAGYHRPPFAPADHPEPATLPTMPNFSISASFSSQMYFELLNTVYPLQLSHLNECVGHLPFQQIDLTRHRQHKPIPVPHRGLNRQNTAHPLPVG